MMATQNEAANRMYYDGAAAHYEEESRIHEEGNKQRIKKLLASLIPHPGVKVLDVCCGTGLYLSCLKDLVAPEKLYGIDISPEMLKLSGRFCRNLECASIYALPFADRSFDLVTCSSAVHHLEDVEKAVSEISRVLKPGGLFLTDYDNNALYAKIHVGLRRLVKLLLVYPVVLKLFRRSGASVRKRLQEKPLTDMTPEELHAFAESQNFHHDGVDGTQLRKKFKKLGFKQVKVFTYHSHRWNTGKPLNFWNSLSHNKLYSVSVK